MPQALPTLYPATTRIHAVMQSQPGGPPDHKPIEMSLREHLLAEGAGQPTAPPLMPQQHPHPSTSPQHAIDPAISGTPYQMSQGDTADDLSEGRKGRRELSTSKRAAQNRAAQRAFRQRKEEYIGKLKDQVKDYEHLVEAYKVLQGENYQLRDYIISLQSRLLETHGEVPPAPAGIDLSRQHPAPPAAQQPSHQHHQSEQPPQRPSSTNGPNNNGGLSDHQIGELQMAAQAAAAAQHGPSMTDSKHPADNSYSSGDYPDKRQKLDDSPVSGGPVGDVSA